MNPILSKARPVAAAISLGLLKASGALMIAGIGVAPVQAQVGRDLDYEALAKRMVAQMALQPGERVLTIAYPGKLDKLWPFVRYEVAKAGGVDLGVVSVMPWPVRDAWQKSTLDSSNAAAADIFTRWFADADLIISADTYGRELRAPAGVALHRWLTEAQDKNDPAVKARRTLHFHWWQGGGNFALPGVQPPPDYEAERVLERAILAVDYDAITKAQRRFEAATRGKLIRVTSKLGTDISFSVGDRGFTIQNGDLSAARARVSPVEVDRAQEIPNGIARVAPMEESVNGVIAFPPSEWAGKPVIGLKLRFQKGRIVSATADSGLDAFKAEMAAGGDAAWQFRDFALGFNPELAVPETKPWIPYYGYGAGVVRLGLGDSSELSGAVRGSYTRWNWFIDTTVTVGDEVWVREGKLLAK